ncbi:MAG: hypothetical protein HW377_1217 [Actinobacteria bacterium]|nr:hypothetical protein [Actinomycetota bacterium]
MANKRKIALFATGGLIALLLLASAALVLFVDVNAHKPRLEAVASDALGMEVRIGGRLGLGLFPGLHVTLEDVRIRNRGADVASVKETILDIKLLPLLRKEVRIVKIGMKRPRISIDRDGDGKFNFEEPERKAGKKTAGDGEEMLPALDVGKISLSDGALIYADKKSGEVIEAGDFNLDVSGLRLAEGKNSDLLKALSFVAEFSCKEFRKEGLALSNLKLRIEGKDGLYGIHPVTADRLVYSGSGGKVTADRLAMSVESLTIGDDRQADLLRRISFTGNAEIGEVRTETLVISDLKSAVAGKDGVLDLKPVTMHIFGGQGSGSLRADLSGAVPHYHVRYSLSKFRIEEFFKVLSPKKVAEGPMNLSATLSMRGKIASEMKRTADGEVSLRGEELTIIGVDLDRVFSRFEASQSFNLVDVGAFIFAGPFAPLITKGYDFAGLFRGTGGSSRIRVLVSDWKVERGIANSKDVAMATNENRVALKGGIDFANERFNDVAVAVVDGRGCAKMRQKIRGPFRDPEVEKMSVLQSVAGPVLKLFQQTKKLFGGKCEVFYAGSVPPPSSKP